MHKILVLLILLLPISSSAVETARGTFVKYGIAIFDRKDAVFTPTKLFSGGFIGDLVGPFIGQYEGGAFFDNSGREGARSSAFGNLSLGVDVVPRPMVVRSLWGIGAISTPDTVLGGMFQFNQDFYVGLTDDRGTSVGLDYKHISSAGIYKPNRGRDFITIQVSIPW